MDWERFFASTLRSHDRSSQQLLGNQGILIVPLLMRASMAAGQLLSAPEHPFWHQASRVQPSSPWASAITISSAVKFVNVEEVAKSDEHSYSNPPGQPWDG